MGRYTVHFKREEKQTYAIQFFSYAMSHTLSNVPYILELAENNEIFCRDVSEILSISLFFS